MSRRDIELEYRRNWARAHYVPRPKRDRAEVYGMKGRRAASDLDHTVLLCFGANVGVPSKAERSAIREYLAARRVA